MDPVPIQRCDKEGSITSTSYTLQVHGKSCETLTSVLTPITQGFCKPFTFKALDLWHEVRVRPVLQMHLHMHLHTRLFQF